MNRLGVQMGIDPNLPQTETDQANHQPTQSINLYFLNFIFLLNEFRTL